MTNKSTFQSEEEIIKRLQVLLRESRGTTAADPGDASVREARELAVGLAERIFDDPNKWGIASIPVEHRDDAVADAFVAMLTSINDVGGRQSIAEWFGVTAESKFRRLWTLAERQGAERDRLAAERADSPDPEPEEEDSPTGIAASMFEVSGGVWESFEHEFPRDGFAMRLRYLLKRTPEQLVVMLDAPSSRAVNLRLGRARDRFRMFCEQSGMAHREVATLMDQLESKS